MTDILKTLKEFAQTQPDTVLFSFHKKGHLTFGELYSKSKKLGQYLKKRLKSDDLLIVAIPAGLECIVIYCACLLTGIPFVPVYPPKNPFDVTRLKSVLDITKSSFVLVEGLEIQEKLNLNKNVTIESIEVALKQSEKEDAQDFIPYSWNDEDLCLLQYSSGSTHQPKGIEILYKNLVASLDIMTKAMELTPKDKGCSWLPPYHDMGLVGAILMPLYVGFPVYMMNPKTFAARPMLWLEIISQERCTLTSAPNFAYEICAHRAKSTPPQHLDLSSLRIAINGSEFVKGTTLKKFSEAFKSFHFDPQSLKPAYGLAESTLMVSYSKNGPKIHSFDRAALHQGNAVLLSPDEKHENSVDLVSCGGGIENIDIKIVDRVDQTLRPHFHIGEIWVKSPSNAKGYYDNVEKTKETFKQKITHEGMDDSYYIRTGDTGFMDPEGHLFITGRLKDYVEIHGRAIAAEEIEEVIGKALAQIGIDPTYRSAALCLNEESQGEVIIIQELHTSHEPKALYQAITSSLKSAISLVPDKICFTKRGGLPRTTSGKVKRHAALVLYRFGVLDLENFNDKDVN